MISRLKFTNGFDLAEAQALQQWADDNLISTPPPSGDEALTIERIWNDTVYGPTLKPAAHANSYSYLKGDADTISDNWAEQHHVHKGPTAWTKSNVYFEVCNGSIDNNYCAFTPSTALNTGVQCAGMTYHYMMNETNEWIELFSNKDPKDEYQKNPPTPADPYRHCTEQDIMDWIDEKRWDEKRTTKNGKWLFYPTGGSFPHPWTDAVRLPAEIIDDGLAHTKIKAVLVQAYFRLVQIDDALPNDFDEATYVTYIGTDTKGDDGKSNWCAAYQGHFKPIRNDGLWEGFGIAFGFDTKDEFEGTLPPLQPVPTE